MFWLVLKKVLTYKISLLILILLMIFVDTIPEQRIQFAYRLDSANLTKEKST